uniref:Uncharacterized protein n=1 Tax=Xiphophorus couchianus TaxID=32473 RepID=A0A3B5MT87_9TELE
MLTERRQTVRRQYEAVQQRRALQDTTNHPSTTKGPPGPPLIVLGNLTGPALQLSPAPQSGTSFQLDRRSRPLRGLARTRLSKDASKLSLLYDEKLLDNDPLRDSKDAAFAQSYLNRVGVLLSDWPGVQLLSPPAGYSRKFDRFIHYCFNNLNIFSFKNQNVSRIFSINLSWRR